MTIRLSIIVAPDFQDSFKRVLASSMPARTGYWLSKLSKVIDAEVQAFNEQRNKLFQRLGQPTEGHADQVSIPADKVPEFITEINSLDHDVGLGLPADLKLQLPESFSPGDWAALIALNLFNPPE